MGKKFFEYSQYFGGKSYKDLTTEEKKEYKRMTNSNYRRTRVTPLRLELSQNKKEDMMILYFLNNIVSNKQAFIKRVLWEYMINNVPEYTERMEDFKFDHDVDVRTYDKLYEYNGVQNTLKAWSELLGIYYPTLRQRVNQSKWSILKAFTTPIQGTKSNNYTESETVTKEQLDEIIAKIKSGEIKFPIKNDHKRPKQRDYSGIKFANPKKCTKDITLEELNNETFKDLLYQREVIK